MKSSELQKILDAYLRIFPKDKPKLRLLQEQVAAGEALNNRKNFRGHIIGDGIVLSSNLTNVLMVHHRILKRWLQPGDADPFSAAKREVLEETGVQLAHYMPMARSQPLEPLWIKTVNLPTNPKKHEPDHSHHNFYYAFVAADDHISRSVEETTDVRWFPLDAPETASIAEALRRLPHVLN